MAGPSGLPLDASPATRLPPAPHPVELGVAIRATALACRRPVRKHTTQEVGRPHGLYCGLPGLSLLGDGACREALAAWRVQPKAQQAGCNWE